MARVETPRARLAWLDYLQMGDGRSLEKLAALYAERGRTAGKARVPTIRIATLQDWSATFGWQARLQQIADQHAAELAAEIRRQRREVFESGLGLDFERVRVLKRLAQRLVDDLLGDEDDDRPRDPETAVQEVLAEVDQVLKGTWTPPAPRRRGKLWLRDVKALGGGPGMRIAMLEAFNRDELEALRGLLDDIAKETGDRVKKLEHAGPKGGPIGVRHSMGADKDDFDFGDFADAFALVAEGGDPGRALAAVEDRGEPLDPADADVEAGALADGAGA